VAKVRIVNKALDSNLNGVNFNNNPSETIFSFGSFSITSNFDRKKNIDYSNELSAFVTPVTLETLNVTNSQSNILYSKTTKAVLNLDNSDLNSFVRFGSALEFLKTSTQNIILNYPGSLFANSQLIKGGNTTFTNFSYNPITNKSTLRILGQYIINTFAILYNQGNSSIPNDNILKNINLSYESYILWVNNSPDDNTHRIIGFTGTTTSQNYVTLIVEGNPFPNIGAGTQGRYDLHIKPNNVVFEEFRSKLNFYERFIISEREGIEGFKFSIKEPTLLDDGEIVFADSTLLWNTSDGYNVDVDTPSYERFLNILIAIGSKYDSVKTDLIARFLTTSSLKTYDLTEEGKITKLLRIYGREFDQLREFIDSLTYINKVTYDKKNNVPDQLIGNLARTFGWKYFSLVNETELMNGFLSVDDTERNLNNDLLPAEVDIELWRRILINTNYFWKSKGTRAAIKAIFLMIGIPEPFINITEYVYTVNGKINTNEVSLGINDFPSSSFPYDNSGYPKAPIETSDFYFQTSGNTDSGQEYMNVFRKAGFDINITADNKKSWIQTGATTRVHPTTLQYYQEDSRLVLNTKEVDVTLDTARGIENDIWNYISHIDYPANSSGFTLPYSYINISIGLNDTTQSTFSLPSNYNKAEGDLEVRFNGILLNPPKTGNTGTTINADYTISGNQFTLTGGNVAKSRGNYSDVIQATYIYTGATHPISGVTVKYVVTRVNADLSGTIIPLPSKANGDVQVSINGIALTKGTNQFIADYIVNPINPNEIIIQNQDVIAFLATEPHVQLAYITVTGSTSIAARSEITRIDSFNSGKIYYNSSSNRYVYRLNYRVNNAIEVKLLVDGIALEPNRDYSVNVNNPFELFLPSGLKFGSVISAYYVVAGSDYFIPIIDNDFGVGDISNLSFLEFIELIQRRLINAKNRKTITDFKGGWYPTLLKVYVDYLKRSKLSSINPLQSNGYTFENLYPFLSKYNTFFQRFVDELLPATIILRKGGLLIRNSVFTRQKFTYKRGVYMGHINHLGLDVDPTTYVVDSDLNYFGNDGSTFLKRQQMKNIDWTGDFVCVEKQCDLNVDGIVVTFPPEIITYPYLAMLKLNPIIITTPISTNDELGEYVVTTNSLEFSPPIPPDYSVSVKFNFETILQINDNPNPDGIAMAIITVTKNNVQIFNSSLSEFEYNNTGTTYNSETIVDIVHGDEIKVILENRAIETLTNGMIDWYVLSTISFTPEILNITPEGTISPIIPPNVDNMAVSIPNGTGCTTCSDGYVPTLDGRCVLITNVSAIPPSSLQIGVAAPYSTYGTYGTRIYNDGFNLDGSGTYITVGDYSVPGFWTNRPLPGSITRGPLNRTALWTADHSVAGQIVGFSHCFNVSENKKYYVGIGCDNYATIRIDGIDLVVQPTSANNNFIRWHIYPINLIAGSHIIEMIGTNISNVGAFGAEIYDATVSELTGATSYLDLGAKLIFSTKDMIGEYIQIGNNGYGWTCPAGYSLNMCGEGITCTKIEYLDCGEDPVPFLYNFHSVVDVQQLAAIGAHIPTITELNDIAIALGGDVVAGGKLKESGTTYWSNPNVGGTNESGFSARGVGSRNIGGNFTGSTEWMGVWSSTPDGVGYGKYMLLTANSSGITTGSTESINGYSVRVIKNSTTLLEGEYGTYIDNTGIIYPTRCIGGKEVTIRDVRDVAYRFKKIPFTCNGTQVDEGYGHIKISVDGFADLEDQGVCSIGSTTYDHYVYWNVSQRAAYPEMYDAGVFDVSYDGTYLYFLVVPSGSVYVDNNDPGGNFTYPYFELYGEISNSIPNVSNGADWIALVSGGRCSIE